MNIQFSVDKSLKGLTLFSGNSYLFLVKMGMDIAVLLVLGMDVNTGSRM